MNIPLALFANIRTNALAYLSVASVTTKKKFYNIFHLTGNGANGSMSSPAGSDRRSPASQRSTPQTTFNSILLVPEAEEIRVSPIVSRKGYLNILDQKTKVSFVFDWRNEIKQIDIQ